MRKRWVLKPQQLPLLWMAIQLAVGIPALAHPSSSSANPPAALEAATQRVTEIHGGAGPWAVVGYRMGMRALKELGLASPLPPTSPSRVLGVGIHAWPRQIAFAWIGDGLHGAPGARLGKVYLKLVEVDSLDKMRSVVIHRETGKRVEFQVLPEFIAKYREVPRERLMAAGQEVLQMADEALFRLTIRP
ncbi:FmdE family protein [Synechococcus sp. W70.1]|uniref:FmdE family protein n=1 Tax=Synechococcus sp. W70.1 TaxID=2964534 RepID=UPI0039C39A3D